MSRISRGSMCDGLPPSTQSWLLTTALLLCTGMSLAQREVTLQQGPLYRTVGSHISIWCRVSGYQGPSRQEFLWSVFRPSYPRKGLQLVGTAGSDYTYPIFSDRVQSGDIYVERLAGDHALLHIRQLQEMDTGEYECYTPGTETPLYGTYSGRVNLRVIPDLLVVRMFPQALRKREGDPLHLFCYVSTTSSQHTHLSVTWHLTSESETQIISLSQDFVLLPGPSYTERFSSGDVQLDKLGNKVYRLSIQALQTSDQGQISCRASEWIQDPDGTWTDIKGKESEEIKLVVSSDK
ncbi:immunoglobulin superfamily member 3-like [Ascaphus truei]|uniref:immunoglobulin superfamily member 3-like n=1 Tax=Ascaphus truei TaxID=8439 RepID=UPI003F593D55